VFAPLMGRLYFKLVPEKSDQTPEAA
jgi:hypothetical protein